MFLLNILVDCIKWILDNINIFAIPLEIFANIVIIFGFIFYFVFSKKDKTILAIEQVSFFRKEILTLADKYIEEVSKDKGKEYSLKRINLKNPEIHYVRENFKEGFGEQLSLIKNNNLSKKSIKLLNILEEISLKIKHYDIINHKSLICIKGPFVDIVEYHAINIIFHREIISGPFTYSAILEIYQTWQNDVDRRTIPERLKDFENKKIKIS